MLCMVAACDYTIVLYARRMHIITNNASHLNEKLLQFKIIPISVVISGFVTSAHTHTHTIPAQKAVLFHLCWNVSVRIAQLRRTTFHYLFGFWWFTVAAVAICVCARQFTFYIRLFYLFFSRSLVHSLSVGFRSYSVHYSV